jgi:hypothetical protein
VVASVWLARLEVACVPVSLVGICRWHVWLPRLFNYSPYLLATNWALADLIVFEQGARSSKQTRPSL